ncbi:MAG: tetratricopeptide repeat protein [Bacteroidales bacterium]
MSRQLIILLFLIVSVKRYPLRKWREFNKSLMRHVKNLNSIVAGIAVGIIGLTIGIKTAAAQDSKEEGKVQNLVPYITLSNSIDSIPPDSVPVRAARDMYISFWHVEHLKDDDFGGPFKEEFMMYTDPEGKRRLIKKDSLYEGFFLTQRGYWHLLRGETDKAMDYFNMALNEKNRAIKGAIYEKIGDIYREQQNYTEAERNYMRALKENLILNCYEGIGGALFGLGKLYVQEKLFNEAIECYSKGIEFYKRAYPNATKWNIRGAEAISDIYKKLGDSIKSEEYKKMAQEEEKREEEIWKSRVKFFK